MKIEQIIQDKKQFLGLLLLADEQESMIDRYIDRGEMFGLYDPDLKSICVVTNEGDGNYEIKNIATYIAEQGKGYGRLLVNYLFEYYQDKCKTLYAGTGDASMEARFYERCGFVRSHSKKNFYVDNYDHPIFENGRQLIDMV